MTQQSQARRKRVEIPPHLTYMIAEKLIVEFGGTPLDVTAYRGYGLGQRDPSTLPNVRSDSESEWQNDRQTAKWRSLRKWVESGSSTGYRYGESDV